MRLDLATAEIAHIAERLHEMLGDDDRAYADCLEGSTNLHELCSRLLASIEDDEGVKAALTEQMAVRKERRDRCDVRIEAKRQTIVGLMQAARLDKLALPEATLSVREVAAKLWVADPEAVPDEYTVIKRVPSMEKIKAAFGVDTAVLPNWVGVAPTRNGLTVRRK